MPKKLPLPQVAEVKEGDLFRVETVDWTGGQIADSDSAEDVKHVDLTQVRPVRTRSACTAGRTDACGGATPQAAARTAAISRAALITTPVAPLLQVHYLSGPIRVTDAEGAPAQPGDLLCVELCNLGPLPGDEWVACSCQLPALLRPAFRVLAGSQQT
jgi:formamidase